MNFLQSIFLPQISTAFKTVRPPESNPVYPWVNTLKGMAILLVVIGHSANETITDFIYCFHMPQFFMLSGFLFSPKPMRPYLKKSFGRLIIPYMAFLAMIALPRMVFLIIHDDMAALRTLIYDMLYGGCLLQGSFGVFWFITVLWFALNFFNVIQNLKIGSFSKHHFSPLHSRCKTSSLHSAYQNGSFILPCLLAIGYGATWLPYPFPWNIHVVPMAVVFIWIGYILKKRTMVSHEWKVSGNNILLLLSCSSCIFVLLFLWRQTLTMDMKYNDYGIPVISLISAVLASMSLTVFAMLSPMDSIIRKMFDWLGQASMVIMYLHLPAKAILARCLDIPDNHWSSVIFGIVFSLAAYATFKQTKMTRKIFLGMRM